MRRYKKLIIFIVICVALVLAADLIVVAGSRGRVYGSDELHSGKYDCILILGCGIIDDETPSAMLKDRLDTGVEMYRRGLSERILVSGDNGQVGYNEIHVMLHYLLDKGIPAENIFCDHAGFSTYDSMHRARSIFMANRVLAVSQRYHLYRALHIAKQLGLDADGCCADVRAYRGAAYREIREIAARDKDLVKALLGVGPKYGGETISLDGDSKKSWERSELDNIK